MRSGLRVSLDQMSRDGQNRGMLVAREERDPRHPQDIPFTVRPEQRDVPAPELSKPVGEGAEAPALAWDSCGKLI